MIYSEPIYSFLHSWSVLWREGWVLLGIIEHARNSLGQ